MADTIKSSPHPNPSKKNLLLWTTLFLFIGSTAYTGRFFYITQQKCLDDLNTLEKNQQAFSIETKNILSEFKLAISKIKPSEVVKTDLQFALYKARYAIELAQLNAKWGQQDTSTTLALLEQADHFLSGYNHADLFPIRQALAHEILQVKATPSIDIPGLLSQLDALQELISKFTYLAPAPQANTPAETEGKSEISSIQSSWLHCLKNTLFSLKQFFIVRHHDTPLEPLLSPAFQAAQKEVIRLNLQEASWAILRKDDTVYQLALKQARDNILRMVEPNHETVQPILKQIEELQAIKINTSIFIPDESLPLVETLIQNITLTQSGSTS